MSDNDGYRGIQKPNSATDEYNAQLFVIRQLLNSRNFVALVKVIAVDGGGGLALAGTVDVQPLVNQLDGQGNAIPHGVVNDIPYFRLQGGANAVIIDPAVGDIGMCLFCDQDISAVKTNKAAANPGSKRRSDMSDGVYLGGLLNGIPAQFVMFTEDGITIKSPTAVLLEAPVVTIDASDSVTINTPTFTVNGASQFNGTVDATGKITAPIVDGTTQVIFAGKNSTSHQHSNGGLPTNPSGPPV